MESNFLHTIGAARVALALGVAFVVAGAATPAGGQPLRGGRGGADRSGVSTVKRSGKILANSGANGQQSEWFLVRPDGTHRRNLPGDMGAATLSPDGTKLAFGCYPKLCVSAADGSHRRVVASPTHRERLGFESGTIAWSPTGRLAYSDLQGLRTVAADGSHRRLIARLPRVTASSISWSHSGRTIAFARDLDLRNEQQNLPGGRIYVVNADGSGLRRLTVGFGPSLSPDGRLLSFTAVQGTRPDAFILNIATRKKHRLARAASAFGFSPDGRRVLLEVKQPNYVTAVAVIGRDGRNLTILGPGVGPVWSPDGTRIAFAGEDGLGVMMADGSRKRTVARGTGIGRLGPLQWRPG
jgi:Tol biopolymer transport system component